LPLTESLSVLLLRRSFFSMNHRLIVSSMALTAVFANVSATVLLIVVAQPGSIWAIVAMVLAVATTVSILAISVLRREVRRTESTPQALAPAVDPTPARSADLPADPVSADDPLTNHALMKLVEECVLLFDELDRVRPSLDAESQDFAEHLGCRLQEILERSGVSIISKDVVFDCKRHQTSPPAMDSSGAAIAETQSPGFAVGRRVFRRARVKLAEIASPEKGSSP
jgi:hypothetical protein